MKRTHMIIAVTSGLLLLIYAAPTVAQSTMTHSANGRGRGRTQTEAIDRALHQALETILEQYDPVVRKGRDPVLIKRLALAHPRVVIQKNYTIVRAVDPRSNILHRRWEVTLRVNLPASQIEKAWDEAQEFLHDFGRPTIALIIEDRVEDNRLNHWYTEKDSDVAQELRQLLRNEQFNVTVISMAEVNRKKHMDMARLSNEDMRIIQELASAHSAQIFVTGLGRVLGPKRNTRNVPGRVRYVWEADAKCKMFWTDNGALIDSFNADAAGQDDGPDKGRITALKKVGRKLAPLLIERIYRQLSIRALEGRPMDLTFLNCGFTEGLKIEDGLATILSEDNILSNQPANGVTTIRVQAKQQPRKLVRSILKLKFDDFKLVATEGLDNTLRFQVKH